MKIPYLPEQTLQALPPNATKILFFAASRGAVHSDTVERSSRTIRMCRSAWRRGVRSLEDAGIITYQSNSQGYTLQIHYSKQFTWIPSFKDSRMWATTARACKALLIICRSLSNKTGTIRMRLSTLAHRLDRSVRTACLALAELRGRGVLVTYRTGRSSWFHVEKPDPQRKLFEPQIAHRPRLLLRLLSLSTHSHLSTALSMLKKSDEPKATAIRNAFREPWDQFKEYLRREMTKRWGIEDDEARGICVRYSNHELGRALEMMYQRHIADPVRYLKAILARGWCAI